MQMPRDPDAEPNARPHTLQAGLTPIEQAHQLLQWVETGNNYARERKNRFRRRSAAIRVTTLTLSAASTIILGLQDLDFWTGLGFSFIAIVTVTSALEPFFAWRFRWVLMEAAQYDFYRIGDELKYIVSSRNNLQQSELDELYGQYKELYGQYKKVWEDLSGQWLEHRRHASSGT